ncbi:hypothetical protein ACT8ZR_29560 [Neobacillus sp. M.A.Huq-85]
MGRYPIYLKPRDLRSIEIWIKEIEKHQYKMFDLKELSKLNLPYNLIGTGYHRFVYELPNQHVLKLAITLRGIKSSSTEASLYKIIPDSLKNSLAEVKEQGHGWIIMKKMDNYVPETEENKETILKLHKEFINYGIKPDDIVDGKERPKWKNIRLNDKGQISIIDYGNFSFQNTSGMEEMRNLPRKDK